MANDQNGELKTVNIENNCITKLQMTNENEPVNCWEDNL